VNRRDALCQPTQPSRCFVGSDRGVGYSQLNFRARKVICVGKRAAMIDSAGRLPAALTPGGILSSGRDPMASPPGNATRGKLAIVHTRGRRTKKNEARKEDPQQPPPHTEAKSASYLGLVRGVMRRAPASSTVAPMAPSAPPHQRDIEDVGAVGYSAGALGQECPQKST